MTTVNKIENTDGTWLFLAPIGNLRLCKATNFEFTVNKVTFVDSSRLAYRRKRFGFPYPISEIKRRYKGLIDRFLQEEKTFATLRMTGNGKELKQYFVKQVNDELAIISLSQLGYSRRRHNSSPVLSEERKLGKRSCFMLNASTETSTRHEELVGKISPLYLDANWVDFQKTVFFFNLLKIISGKIRVAPHWRQDITNAAILAGQSQSGLDIPQCFLWNIIALETLLTGRDDKYSESLPERAEAFIGWSKDWTIDDFKNKIRNIYRKRCVFVHTGERNDIKIEDILFSDDLLLNVLTNIAGHPNNFGSKNKLIEFSKQVQAENLLGIKTKIRPKTLRLLRPRYREEDKEKI